MIQDFVHLRVHSEYSLVDSLVRLPALYQAACDAGMGAVALTDQSNLFAIIKFYQGAQNSGIKPICGADIWLSDTSEPSNSRALLLAASEQGYRNLMTLISLAWQHGQTGDRALVQWDWLQQYHQGLIVLSGGRQGDIGQALLGGHHDRAKKHLERWQQCFGDRFYLELMRTGRSDEETYIHQAMRLAAEYHCPVVATNDVCFLQPDDFEAHETRVCIGEGGTLDDPKRESRYSDAQYFKTAQEMAQLFADIPQALTNSVEIAKRCNIQIPLGTPFLPDYPIPADKTLEQFFQETVHAGLTERLHQAKNRIKAEQHSLYYQRLDFELTTILHMGFAGYFLVVMDFIQWSKQHGVPVGPGRGSGAGSLVAYALEITDIDPLPYDLLFERFLNPERVSMPDFDIDFCMDGRDRVIDYVAEKYGRDAVSQIVTFGTMAAKAVVRDVARVQGKSYGLADKLSKMIPFSVGMTLKKALQEEKKLQTFLEEDEPAKEIWDMALKLEGITRNVGKHAGGVVIAPTKLTDFTPLYCDEEGKGLVTQYDKNDVETAGLVKFDFLGLRTLTIIDWALATINKDRQANQQDPLDITHIDLDDKQAYKLLQSGRTTAVFQLESRGMKELVKRLQPSCFEDIIALVALFRPGPLQSGMVDDFINRKRGNAKVSYPHPDFEYAPLEPILKPTYGIIVYQEQVMQIAQVLAGYTLGEADMLRRAMGKKKPEEMAKQRSIFEQGAIAQGVHGDLSMKIFDLVEKFAGYGFNKSHSAAYALVSYQTLWLKCHYPAAFMAAALSSEMHNTDKIVILIQECQSMELTVLPPDVNQSHFQFTVNEQGQIIYGLGAIKGIGEGPVEALTQARQQKPFSDLFDFCLRLDTQHSNKRVLEALIASGAADVLAPEQATTASVRRAILSVACEAAVKTADQTLQNQHAGVNDLFGSLASATPDTHYERFLNTPPWSDQQRLSGEKDTLGHYLSGHPTDAYAQEMRDIVPKPLAKIAPAEHIQKLCGLVVALRTMTSKNGQKMAFITLEDATGRIDVSLFRKAYEAYEHLLEKDTLLLVEGEVEHDDYSGALRISARKVFNWEQARNQYAQYLRLSIDAERCTVTAIEALAALLRAHPGDVMVMIDYQNEAARARLSLPDAFHIMPSQALLGALQQQWGADQLRLIYDAPD